MKKTFTLILMAFAAILPSQAQYNATIYRPVAPVVVNRDVNLALEIKIANNVAGSVLNSLSLAFSKDTPLNDIENIDVFYTGTASSIHSRTQSQAIQAKFSDIGGGQQIITLPANSIHKAKAADIKEAITLNIDQKLTFGDNYFFVSINLKEKFPLTKTIDLNVSQVIVNNRVVELTKKYANSPLRVGISVRDAGDEGVHTYRIPALVTANDGTLLASYDIRRDNNFDLQENVQVGLNRSTDGGQSWEPMQVIMDMRGTDGLPDKQNGIGDPALLIDTQSGDIYAMALWNHGIGVGRGWWNVQQGTDYRKGAAQVLISKSSDSGKSWSEPYNITRQIKDSTWYILLQGPGRGIVMRDGTLVFPFQYVDSARMPHATVVSSKDKGVTWSVGTSARSNTTEAQVVEVNDGELMLNMRDNRGGSRAVLTTTDLGETWSEHPTSRTEALKEPVCMASLIEVPADKNILGKDILLFSNPNHTKSRSHITIKASLDKGMTWVEANQLLIDEEPGWGYTCLTMIDPETVGILYESSRGQMLFQAIPLLDIVKNQ